MPLLFNPSQQSLLAVALSVLVTMVLQAVGEQDQQVLREMPRDHPPAKASRVDQAERRSRGSEPFRRAEPRHPERMRMSAAGIHQPSSRRIENPVEDGEVHLGLLEFVGERIAQQREHFVGRRGRVGVNACGREHLRGDQRRREAVGCDVAEHRADAATTESREGVEITTDRFRRIRTHGNIGVAVQHGWRGHQPHLKVMRQMQFLLEPFPVGLARAEAGALECGSDLGGHGGDQLGLFAGKSTAAGAVGEGQRSYHARWLARDRIADRDGDHFARHPSGLRSCFDARAAKGARHHHIDIVDRNVIGNRTNLRTQGRHGMKHPA